MSCSASSLKKSVAIDPMRRCQSWRVSRYREGLRLAWCRLHHLFFKEFTEQNTGGPPHQIFQSLPATCQQWRRWQCASGARPDCAWRLSLVSNPLGINRKLKCGGPLAGLPIMRAKGLRSGSRTAEKLGACLKIHLQTGCHNLSLKDELGFIVARINCDLDLTLKVSRSAPT